MNINPESLLEMLTYKEFKRITSTVPREEYRQAVIALQDKIQETVNCEEYKQMVKGYKTKTEKIMGLEAMGSETQKLATISFVTDNDGICYEIGDVEGAFTESELKKYIKRFGHEKLCSHLAFLQHQVWEAVRKINSDRNSEEDSKFYRVNTTLVGAKKLKTE
jgi:hypothetical protein